MPLITLPTFTDIAVQLNDHVAVVELCRPPHNFFDVKLIGEIASAFEALDQLADCRAIVLAAQGKSFCAGANFGGNDASADAGKRDEATAELYRQAVRLFRTSKPIIAAIHGPAIGGGLGLAMVADFRVTCADATFSANFTKLGFHPGFGLTVTLPELIGKNAAALLFLTSRRIKGDEALRIGLVDVLVAHDGVRAAATSLAREIANCSPLGVVATRATLRKGLADRIAAATEHELSQQSRLRNTEDFQEGIRASTERREPKFSGR
jgi:enoyl-CoA hydratase/carnithine racemase